MAVTSASNAQVQILKAPGSVDSTGLALIVFDVTGTYAQADDSILTGVAALIQNSTRNGKTVTMRAVMGAQHSFRADTGLAVGLKTAAISTNDVTFAMTLSTTAAYSTTEFTDATALPALTGKVGIMVWYTEA